MPLFHLRATLQRLTHRSLQTQLLARRLLLFLALAAVAYILVLGSIRLTTHQYPGLAPDPLSFASITETKPSLATLKTLLQPIPDHLVINAPISTILQLENDGDQPAHFQASIAVSGSCLSSSVPTLETIVPAHQAIPLTLTLAPQNCAHAPIPQELLLSLAYTWSLNKLPGHRASSAPQSPETNRLQLPPNQPQQTPLTLNLSIHLPNNRQTAHGVPAQPQRSYAGLITLSPIEISTPRERSIRRFYHLANAIAKDFTWPILLAFLAFFTQALLARRGERQQIFNAMLPILTKLILEHYVPIARRVQTVGAESDKIAASNPPPAAPANLPPAILTNTHLCRTFAAIILMRRRLLHLFNSNGGIFFRSTVGEELFDLCLTGFYRNFQNVTGDEDACETLALALSPKDMPIRAQTRIFSPHWKTIAEPLYGKFAKWAIDSSGARTKIFDKYLLQLFLAEAVISFECNRIYYQTTAHAEHSEQNWYFDSPAFYFEGDLSQLPDDTEDAKKSAPRIRKLYTQYLNGLPAECFGKARYL
ncbi:MAG TPA: hypothetical protein VL346_12100 [Acidobacteriaceae bacterium]|nr:hypothetical protein [Acidobacteriaceae bacterium]